MEPFAQWDFNAYGDWQSFPSSASAEVEDAYLAWCNGGQSTVVIRSGRYKYKINLEAKTQENADLPHGTKRALRRVQVFSKDDVNRTVSQLKEENRRSMHDLSRLQDESNNLQNRVNELEEQVRKARKIEQDRDQLAIVVEKLQTKVNGLEAECQTMVPRTSMWRSLQAMADRIFALRSYPNVENTDSCPYDVIDLQTTDPRRQWLEYHFKSSCVSHRRAMSSSEWCPKADVEILGVAELYHPKVVQSYRHELAQLQDKWQTGCPTDPELDDCIHVRTDLGGVELNEVLLFHGCKCEAVNDIAKEGFDSRLSGQNAGASLGAGTYFAMKASKADFYTDKSCHKSFQDGRFMFVGRVALGSIHAICHYDRSLRRPPLHRNSELRHDSVLGLPRAREGVLDHAEAVVYKSSQAVPQFVIAYRHKPDCQCRTCIRLLR